MPGIRSKTGMDYYLLLFYYLYMALYYYILILLLLLLLLVFATITINNTNIISTPCSGAGITESRAIGSVTLFLRF